MSVYLRGTCKRAHRHSGECKHYHFSSDLMGNVIEVQSQKPERNGKQNKRNSELGERSLKVDLEKRKLAR